ncbi:DUF7537 family lipoprotein [Candidatus Halobonum tyrrellensis]|uniref:Lipoprotein n=1 Tax=Candidatus Halobonum tyrrellensis G22 TaxID=1324957 RepID=V4HJU0_9EURY|nr:hypothetical protein [Candidatus Halobonum tyrrellensis]ESP88184.1 hypothetical protein K933_10250 [Candidatus Halobonum tyrrellensis G22]
MRAQLAALAVAILLATAGCSGFDALGAADDAGPRTVNPALRGTPTPSPTPTPVSTPAGGLPPGVTADAVDAERLVAAHRASLSNRSFTTVRHRAVTRRNGRGIVNESLRVRVDPDAGLGAGSPTADADRRLVSVRSHWGNDQVRTTTYWTNGSVTVGRDLRQNATTNLTVVAGERPAGVDSDGSDRLRSLLRTLDPRFAGTVTDDGRRLAVLEARPGRVARERPSTGQDLPSWRSVDVRLLVAPDGRVVAYRLTYQTTQFGQEAVVTDAFRVADVGNTAVGRPGWVERALAGGTTGGPAPNGTATAQNETPTAPNGTVTAPNGTVPTGTASG